MGDCVWMAILAVYFHFDGKPFVHVCASPGKAHPSQCLGKVYVTISTKCMLLGNYGC